MGRGSQQGEGETHTLSTANAGHGLNIVSGQDTRLTGAQVSADRVTVAAGYDLLLASEQDHDDYHSRQLKLILIPNALPAGIFPFKQALSSPSHRDAGRIFS